MSQSKIRSYINIASFKLNRISLLNQSKFNPLFYNIYKINNNMNLFQQEKKKVNPLTRKNKIIKKHNILKKIDFCINTNQTNHIFPKAILEPMTNNNMYLPKLAYNNNRIFHYNKKDNNDYNKTKLYQNSNLKNSNSFSFNSVFSKYNYFNKNINNSSNYNDVTGNETAKSFKPNFTDKEIQTTDDLRTVNNEYKINNINNINNSNSNLENKAYKIIKSKLNFNEKNENDSSDDFDYKKDLEKIITTKSKSNFKDLKGISNYLSNNNSNNSKKNKTNYILLKNLYKIKNFKNERNDISHQTEQNLKFMVFKNKKIDKSIMDKFNIIPRLNNINFRRDKLIRLNKYPKKGLTKDTVYNIINQSFESKNQNSMNNGNKE